MKIALGSDHRGVELKAALRESLVTRGITAEDCGPADGTSVDYPDYARQVSTLVSKGITDSGILICGSGLGMSMAANKISRVRAALCLTPQMAKMARAHNNANVLVLSADASPEAEALEILDAWLSGSFEGVLRHKRRIQKMHACESSSIDPLMIYDNDPEVYAAIEGEAQRQRRHVELLANENLVSRAVREALGSSLAMKYVPGSAIAQQRGGAGHAEDLERLACDRAKQLFGCEHANVQPYSGSLANAAVYLSVMQPGDTVLCMTAPHEASGAEEYRTSLADRLFKIVRYGVDRATEQIDYDKVEQLAAEHKPRLIVAGVSVYSRITDFKKMRRIADSVDAFLMADMGHIAGLVAAGCHPSPVPMCEFVTTTTHNTLRGPRGGMILCQERFAADIDREVSPGLQTGPHMHVVAAKAVCLHEALRPSFRKYQQQVVRNAQSLAEALMAQDIRVVTGGTDNHLVLVDLSDAGVGARKAVVALDAAGLTVSKDRLPAAPGDTNGSAGVCMGVQSATARGMAETEMTLLADCIATVLRKVDAHDVQASTAKRVEEIAAQFPIPD